MKPRPLIKWKSFWLGILVLGFLGWGWNRSVSDGEKVYWSSSGGTVREVSHRAGVFTYRSWNSPPPDYGGGVVHHWTSSQGYWVGAGSPCKFYPGTSLLPDFFVCHWFLILLFLVPWVSFLAWRVRKQRRLTKADA